MVHDMGRIGALLNARKDLTELGRLFVDFQIKTCEQQTSGSGQAAKASPSEDDFRVVRAYNRSLNVGLSSRRVPRRMNRVESANDPVFHIGNVGRGAFLANHHTPFDNGRIQADNRERRKTFRQRRAIRR